MRPAFLRVLSCRISEDTADLLHLPAYQALRELGIMPRHIRIGVPQNFRQHVYRHSVLHRKAGERMPGAMGREAFVDIANNRDFFQIAVEWILQTLYQRVTKRGF